MNAVSVSTNSDINPVRVAHVVGKMVGGGLESTVLNYYRHIDRSKVQYDFLADIDSTLIPQAEIESLGGRVILIPPYQHQIEYQKEVYRIIKENNYKIVYSHMNTLSVFPLFAAWRANVPIRVAHNHSTAGRGEFFKNVMKYSLRPFAKVFPTTLCACSNFAGEWLFGNRVMSNNRVTIWQNALDIDKFLYSEDVRNEMRRELGIKGKFVVAHVGRFIHQKNHHFVVDIFSEVHKKKSNAVLLLVGDGHLMNEVKIKIDKLGLTGSVIFLGNRSDVEKIYQAMDVFILPSFYEGLGMVAVEAQIAALPVICSDQVPDEAKISDTFFYLSLEDSAEKWADKIIDSSQNHERLDMKQHAVKSGYEITVAAEKMTDWYCELLGIR